MPEKIKFFPVTIFAADNKRTNPGPARQMEILLPIDAISHLTAIEQGNPNTNYKIHIKKNYPCDLPFTIKSYNPAHMTAEQVELIQ